MQRINESAELEEQPLDFRKWLVTVDDSDECERALRWTIEHLYREGDEVHLLHIIQKQTLQRVPSLSKRPPVDVLPTMPTQEPASNDKVLKRAESFINSRCLPRLNMLRPEPQVHIAKSEVDTESIGNTVCRKAEELRANALIVSARSKSRLQRFFLGSITNHCVHHSRVPVMVVH